jgi:pyruvate kinase
MAASTTDTPLPHTMNPTTHTPIAGDTLTPTTIATPDTWDPAMCHALIDELWALRAQMVEAEARHANVLTQVSESYRTSARNFVHYLTLREEDRRHLQAQLASIGVSSLGRAETHVLANLDKVLGILHQLVGKPWADLSGQEPTGIHRGQTLLAHHAHALLGGTPPNRVVRIMLTLPSEAATDPEQVQQWVNAGMDIARINCAHDGPTEWAAMAAHVRQAAQQAGRPVKVLMDLGGPKLRTGLLPPGPAVLKVRPQRDIFGRVIQPALLGLRPTGSSGAVANATAHVGVKADWLAGLEVGDSIEFVDARDAHRTLKVVATRPQGALAELDQTAYFVPSTRLTRHRHGKHAPANSRLNDLPRQETRLTLQTGDKLRLVSEAAFAKGDDGTRSDRLSMPEMPCTLPEVFEQVRPGEPIWFDDGRIGGVIRAANAKGMTVEVTHAREGGERLASDKGINLPDSQLDLPALTEADLRNLPAVAQLADMVGLSFVQHAADVDLLRQHLLALNAGHIGIVLKIETRRAFENLPALLLSAMQSPAVGIMIARGDLAVECGFERLAEIQEELLWAAEAAHMPVIWATQVLETLAKTGMPSRAEITDAAMGERAECVMLNKGPHILAAMHTLDNIMQRMQMHQSKKRSLLRALHAWTTPAVATPPSRRQRKHLKLAGRTST